MDDPNTGMADSDLGSNHMAVQFAQFSAYRQKHHSVLRGATAGDFLGLADGSRVER